SGFIKSYHALVDEGKLGRGIKAYIQIAVDFHTHSAISEFVSAVKTIPEVIECHHVTGDCDFMLKVYVKDIKAYEAVIMEKIAKIPFVKTFQTMMMMSTSKKEPIIPLEYYKERISTQSSTTYNDVALILTWPD